MAEPPVAVVGAGLMGSGIAQVFATAGSEVRVFDSDPNALATLRARVESNLRALGEPTVVAGRVEMADSISAATGSAELVVEAVAEDLELKRRIFAELAEVAADDAILATNTSVISIGEIAAGCAAAERVVGTHWWNPPYLVPLVEVVEHPGIDPLVVERTLAILRAAGKVPVHVRRDIPGFVGNRLQHALWREALALVDAEVCDPETIDTVVRSGFGARLAAIGPIENADLVGLDLTEAIHAYVLPHLDTSTEPAAGLRARVARGELGAKSGGGYLDWADGDADAARDRIVAQLRGQADRRITTDLPRRTMNETIITAALTGPIATKADNPALPTSPEEIAEAAKGAWEAGAAVVHVHLRDADGNPTADLEVARRVVGLVREGCGALVQLSTGVGLTVPFEEREALVEARPEMATLNPCSMTFAAGEFRNPPDGVRRLAARMLELGVKPEVEIYDTGHLDVALALHQEGLLADPLQFSIVLGVRGGAAATPESLVQMVSRLPEGCTWQAIGIGRGNLAMTTIGLAMGGNARTGMEDTLMVRRGVPAESNAQLVERLAGVARSLEREPVGAERARELLLAKPE